MKSPSLQDLLAVAIEAAQLGGERTLQYFNTGVVVETKADNTPVTRADRESEEVMRNRIRRTYPDHVIVGEEGGTSAGNAQVRWIIDPIDGTKTFIHGVPLYGVLVGVEVEGRAAVGVIHLPAMKETITAAEGLGCQWNGQPARVSSVSKLKNATLLTSCTTMAMERSDAYENLVARTKLHRSWGDCYGYALVATGRAEVMIDPVMFAWDCAPMLPILREAGGAFTTWAGEPTIWGPDSVATNGVLHTEVLAVLKGEQRRG